MVYVTGDTHGKIDIAKVFDFLERITTTKDDILIILGDVGLNWFGDFRDNPLKDKLEKLPITFFCIHGNHERRPATILDYKIKDFHNGKVYRQDEYPSINFAIDGETFEFDGMNAMVIGGAYSVDKMWRREGLEWWPDEQPSDEIKQYVESNLEKANWKVDLILSHTVPCKYLPVETFTGHIDNVDYSTEEWLDKIEDKLDYKKWYCGHYHIDKKIDKIRFMYNDIDVLNV